MTIIFYSILWISMAAEDKEKEFDDSPFNKIVFSNSPFNSQPYLNFTTAESLDDFETKKFFFSQKKMQVLDNEDAVIEENYIEKKSQFDLALQKIDDQLYKIQSVSARGSIIINEISPFTLRNKSNTCPHFTCP